MASPIPLWDHPHKQLIRTLFLLTLEFAHPRSAAAQMPPLDTLHLSLAAVLARVRDQHPLGRAGAATVSAAQARAAAIRAYENPRLEIDRTTLRELDNLRLVQPIRWPGESRALGGVGRAEVASAQAGANGQLRVLGLEIAQRYTDALRDVRSVALAFEAESLAQRALDRASAARRLAQAGDLTVLQAQVSLDAALRARLGAEAQRDASAATLAILLGDDPEKRVVFEDDLSKLAPVAATESLLVRALATDPESARLRSEAERARQEGFLARARRWPQIELGPAAAIGAKTTVGLALGLGLPLWNRQGDAMRAAAADREAARAQLDARSRELSASVLDVRTTLTRVDRELGLLRGGELVRARQAAILAARALEQGGPYLSAWLTARQAYLDALRAELDLEWQGARARLLFRHLTGTLLAEPKP